ncbi:Formin GTPase-binding domain-containing protein [Madurella fahalii]|uniref:Formin GTPase-binding domain-containing protein n=1 Tax=Madurella fahalii TaxID=1157608 RepID=A0ABQ0G388_9PEZI
MSKNNTITSFFKPVAKQSKSPKPQGSTPRASPTPPPPSPSPLPALFSSSPPEPATAVRDRNAVIRGSDDEDDEDFDSDDDELPPLFPLPSLSTAPVQAPRKDVGLYATPKAKRRALEFHSSPLTINTRHKFDIKALLRHAEADIAIEESEQRAAALLDSPSPTPHSTCSPRNPQTTLHDAMLGVLSDPGDSQDEGHRDRLLRAVKRTEATVRRKEWYFFDRQGPANSTAIKVRQAFPKTAATGAWAFLAPERHRSEFFEDGLPYHVQCKALSLPDEIFIWVLNEAPHAKSKKLQEEYLRLLGACPNQAERLIDENAIAQLFREVGASERALTASFQPDGSSGQGAPYPEHEWPRLRTVLRILTETAHALKIQSLTRAMAILLRLGIDNIVREDQAIATHYQDALLQIVLAVPLRAWDSFCGDVSDSLYSHTQDATLRWNAVSSIPLLHPQLVELRRRLALVFVFDDPQRAYARPENTFSMRSVLDRLDHADEFIVDRNNTDYFELLALSEMLSVAISDGSPPSDSSGPEVVKQYNAEVDEVAHRIKFMWSNIHEQGAAYMSRLEARVQLRDFERKLLHVVRTRPPPKEDIFGLEPTEDDIERPKQQKFMQKFLAKSQPPPKTPTP